MKIAISCDHAGYDYAEKIIQHLKTIFSIDVLDLTPVDNQRTDYPDKAKVVSKTVADGFADYGILICGTGIGMSIAANKIYGIRAALVTSDVTSQMSRLHNDANVICIGARTTHFDDAIRFIEIFLSTTFEGGRHIQRIDKISALHNN